MNRQLFYWYLVSLCFYASPIYSATYYFSSEIGDDGRSSEHAINPDKPWKTIDKFNEILPSLSPGDSVLFKRGDVFFGSWELEVIGTAQLPVYIGAYGEGSDPIISGFKVIDEWTEYKDGIFYAKLDVLSDESPMVSLNGEVKGKGRFPNMDSGYLFPKTVGENFLEVDQLSKFKNLEGAELVVRKNHWVLDIEKVVSHKGKSFTSVPSSGYPYKNGFGVFVQGHLDFLDEFGEWYYDRESGIFYMFFGDSRPESNEIQVSVLESLLVTSQNSRHVHIEGVSFMGSAGNTWQLEGGIKLGFNECQIAYSGKNAVYGTNLLNLSITNSAIEKVFNSGIYLISGNRNVTLTGNFIKEIYLWPGMGQSADNNGFGIFSISDSDLISGNTLCDIGYSGISFRGNYTRVLENHVEGYCLVKNDGGGIYTYSGKSNLSFRERLVAGNIVMNGLGSAEGTPLENSYKSPPVDGIYLDDNASGVLVEHNFIKGIRGKGIHIHNANNVDIKSNYVEDCQDLIFFGEDDLGGDIEQLRLEGNVFNSTRNFQNTISTNLGLEEFSKKVEFERNEIKIIEGQTHSIQVREFPKEGNSYFRKVANPKLNTIFGPSNQFGIGNKVKIDIDLEISKSVISQFSRDYFGLGGINCSKNCQFNWKDGEAGSPEVLGVEKGEGKSSLKIDFKNIEGGGIYRLVFFIESNQEEDMQVYLRQSASKYEILSFLHGFQTESARKKVEIPMLAFKDEDAPSIIFEVLGDGSNNIFISKLTLEKVKFKK